MSQSPFKCHYCEEICNSARDLCTHLNNRHASEIGKAFEKKPAYYSQGSAARLAATGMSGRKVSTRIDLENDDTEIRNSRWS